MKKNKNKKKSKFSDIILIIIFIVGLALILYPIISNALNKKHATKLISDYEDAVKASASECDKYFKEATEYNRKNTFSLWASFLTEKQLKKYNSVLDITGTGIMGYIEIPQIDVKMPIYHDVGEDVLQIAAGHINWSSLPVGGASTHSVISGHRGLPSAKLFTDLDKLEEGDYFKISVLNRSLWYEVDKISIVLPEEVEDLVPVRGMDYVTLVTCTPYGINTHRLLVRGHRVNTEDVDKSLFVTADAITVNPLIVAVILFVPLGAVALSLPFIFKPKKQKKLRRKK